MRHQGTAILAAAMLAAAPASAGEMELDVIGEVEATLDGEERRWVVIESDEPVGGDEPGASGRLTASEFGGRNMWSLSVQGHDPESDSVLFEQVLNVTFNFGRMDADVAAPGPDDGFDVEIMFIAENGINPDRMYMSDADNPAEATLDTLQVNGERGQAEGSFSGTLCRGDMMQESVVDEDECMEVSGRFDTEIMVIKDEDD